MNANRPKNRRRRSLVQRAALIAGGVVGALVALVVIAVGGTLLALRTDWGGERLRRQVVSRVNAQIQGNLEIKRLSFGGNRLVVWGVAVRDPEGQMVAQIARTEIDLSLSRVLHKELRLTAVEIENPVLDLISGEQGLNLSRAIAPQKRTKKKPTAPSPRTTKEGWVIRLDRFELTRGELALAVAEADSRSTKAHLSDLRLAVSVRYATGNGSLNLKLKMDGENQLAPGRPLRLAGQAIARDDVYRFDVDGDLLGGSIKAHGNVDAHRLTEGDGLVALAIPRQAMAGNDWGPIAIDATAHPGSPPRLNALLAVPGVQLTAQTKDDDGPALGLDGRLTVDDLGLTARAIHALTGGTAAQLAGHGQMTFAMETPTPAAAAPAAALKGFFDNLRFGATAISRLTIEAQAAQLSRRPASADLKVSAGTINAGTTELGGLALSVKLADHDVAATVAVASPARLDVGLQGSLDDDQRGFSLNKLAVAFPGERWTSQGTARLRFDNVELSLANLRLVAGQQVLTLDGSKRADEIAARLALTGLRLDHLPTALIDPGLHLDGQLDADLKASGQTDAPKVAANVQLKQARYQGFSKIDATATATLHDQQVDGTATVDAPFLQANLTLNASTEAPAAGAPIDLRLDVKHLDISRVLSAAQQAPLGDGRLNVKLRLKGSADQPDMDLAVEAFGLAVTRPIKDAKDTRPLDIGHARVRLTYAHREARANIDFRSSHGGTMLAEAAAHVDLSYPHVTEQRLVVAKIPVRGKVVARNLDVAWIARFNPRVESLGGQVTADARVAGTISDPQFIGDVHWKNGQVVTTAAPPTAAAVGPAVRRQAARRPASSSTR